MTPPTLEPRRGVAKSHLWLAVWVAGLFTAAAQTSKVDWFTISAGGGTSTGGVYTLQAVIGQPAASRLSGGPYSLEAGFLAAVGLVQIPGAPKLELTLTNHLARVAWPLPAEGYRLQKTTTLEGNPIPWGPVSGAYQTNSTHVFVLEPLVPGRQFFRLEKTP
ncbi:hypothetical protein NXS98_17100 [Fontisphaera persica]|uniref:hypothetical protein n=1 Tax=Fontisphaera persica TaxID=2974023 RepID=UPI0024BF6B45|nr:hypothetical protein [Fontisphaera persica]WCJ59412.1 hypothetical protein NXS98_17100 [Fontisphaera persica]